jgi:protein-S-isoprenylcysteine O-methyltransferase Ste14
MFFRQVESILALPFVVIVLIPAIIVYFTQSNLKFSLYNSITIFSLVIGIMIIIVGLLILTKTILLFSHIGKGTLAPWDPTRKLVVIGPYRYVRNPMIVSVLLMLLGESILLHSFPIFIFMFTFWILNHIYFIKFEEPGLIRRFGEEYIQYSENVPRWIPRFTPWKK